MKPTIAAGPLSARPALVTISVGLAIAIFIADTVTPLEIAFAVFYTIIVLLSVNYTRKTGVVLISVGCIVLTVVSYALSFRGTMQSGLINTGISISAIVITTYLVLKIDAARNAIHEARQQLSHTSRVTALGELSASIAHEVNQPLTAIITSGNACKRWLSDDRPPDLEKARSAVDRMVADARRASDIIVHVRDLARKRASTRQLLNVNRLVEETVSLTQTELQRHRISLLIDHRQEDLAVQGDRVLLQQTLLNLLLNAIDAMDAVPRSSRQLTIRAERVDDRVNVSVCDTGPGIPEADRARIFEPFHSNKPDGLGMGLAIASSVVESHGGTLQISSNEPRGVILTFSLPAAGEPSA